MPIIKSAKKRVRQEKKRKIRNQILLSKLKSSIKDILESIKKKDKKKSQEYLKIMEKAAMKCAKNGLLHKKNVSKKVSNLNKAVKNI